VNGSYVQVVEAGVSSGETDVDPEKKGEAAVHSLLGWVAFGDASIKAAMESAGITKIHHVDYDGISVLGLYARFNTTVYGE
jgi:hydrogenase maturation factor HypE